MKMKYALVHDKRLEAQPGLTGKCQCCSSPVIAKCGNVRIRHWAHKGKLNCDPWWEETEWHRAWKDRFPEDWQEILHLAENGDKHIADVKTDQGYVIEFQHSPIKPEECQSREDFYKKMMWIVNGTRRLRDKDKFIDVWEQSNPLHNKIEVRRLRGYFDECALLLDWSSRKVPVFFDFGDDVLWLLLPKTIEGRYVFRIRRNELVSYLLPASKMSFEALLKELNNFLIAKEVLATVQQSLQRPKINRPLRRVRRDGWPL